MKKIFTLLSIIYSSITFAQSPCDSLDINVKYYPFYDSMIQVDVINHGQTFFGYPVFKIYDQTQDSVAVETLNLFGIAQASSHILDVNPNNVPTPSFNGNLVLFYIDSVQQTCAYQMNFQLCLDTCKKVYPYLGNFGSAMVEGTANWNIKNSSQQIVASGTFTLDSLSQNVTDSACLLKGDYTLHVSQGTLSQGGQCQLGIYTSIMAEYPQAPFNDTAIDLPFNMYEACPNIGTNVNEVLTNTTPLNIYSHNTTVYINSYAGKTIGNVTIHSIDGKHAFVASIPTASYNIDLSSQPAGIYIVRVTNEGNTTYKKVFISR